MSGSTGDEVGRRTVLGAVGAAALLGAVPTAGAQDSIQSVLFVVGAAVVIRGDASQELRIGMAVHAGDRVATGSGARVSIDLGGGGLLVIGPDSIADLTDLSLRPGNPATIAVLSGILRLATPEDGTWVGLEVSAPTAIASVRSTEWIIDATPANAGVLCLRGGVEVLSRATGTSVPLSAGQGTDVPAGGPPSPPAPWGPARIADVVARTATP